MIAGGVSPSVLFSWMATSFWSGRDVGNLSFNLARAESHCRIRLCSVLSTILCRFDWATEIAINSSCACQQSLEEPSIQCTFTFLELHVCLAHHVQELLWDPVFFRIWILRSPLRSPCLDFLVHHLFVRPYTLVCWFVLGSRFLYFWWWTGSAAAEWLFLISSSCMCVKPRCRTGMSAL